MEELRNSEKIVAYRPTSKTFLKMAGGRMHTSHHSNLDLLRAISYRNHERVKHILVIWPH